MRGVLVAGIIIFGQQEPVGHPLKIQSLKCIDDFGFNPGSPVAGLVLGIEQGSSQGQEDKQMRQYFHEFYSGYSKDLASMQFL